MRQADLFAEPSACDRGRHGRTIDRAPQFFDEGEGCVNIDHECSECHRIISVTSWTRRAWDDHTKKGRTA